MNTGVLFAAIGLAFSGQAQTIIFTNKTASFTTVQGRHYAEVKVLRADNDAIVWSDYQGNGGRVFYTNLTPDVLEDIGIPTNRIQAAWNRAAEAKAQAAKAKADLDAAVSQTKEQKSPLARYDDEKEAEAAIKRWCESETGFRRLLLCVANTQDMTGIAEYQVINSAGGVEKVFKQFTLSRTDYGFTCHKSKTSRE